MKMHVLPFVVPLVPHAAFLTLLGMRYALFVHVLRQPDICDASSILAQQMDMGIQDCRIDRLTVFPQDIIKVKFVEIHSLD